jgi:glutamate-1-semialdehyde 2,1-aminomutase
MTGFRVAYSGAQSLYGVLPDITCLGKIIGGGMPVGAYGGRHDIMSHIAPQGPVYQAGTLSGNPVAMAAGIATLSLINTPRFYEDLDKKADQLISGLKQAADSGKADVYIDRVGSMMGMFFTKDKVLNFDDAKKCDLEKFTAYYQGMRSEGIYLAPSQFEAFFMSSAHETEHIESTVKAAEKILKQLA